MPLPPAKIMPSLPCRMTPAAILTAVRQTSLKPQNPRNLSRNSPLPGPCLTASRRTREILTQKLTTTFLSSQKTTTPQTPLKITVLWIRWAGAVPLLPI